MLKAHSFHIPVMGIGFTVDTPLKVSQFGIDSVMAIGDDSLLEKLRKMYSDKFKIPYQEISTKVEDFRAKRITSYLNLVKNLAEQKFETLKNASIEKGNELKEYLKMLPDSSELKAEFLKLSKEFLDVEKMKVWLKDNLSMGSLDVNIMTKLDKVNYRKGEKLSSEFNDAHAALRGFAQSDLNSSVIFSAGMNPRLYSYIEQFDDFYPNEKGIVKKKIVLKVSDFRSAFIQGKFLAKKGIWVSEYRVESGLNCGGHAFATEGYLFGPILKEFKENKEELIASVHDILIAALAKKGRITPEKPLELKITAQGGVGTAEEHQFLINEYGLDSVGWGSPFLLVPDVVNIDSATIEKLKLAKEKDLYLSNVSPLGIPFNNLRSGSKEKEKNLRIEMNRPGSPCVKEFLVFNSDYTEKPICTASSKYQKLKIQELKSENISKKVYQERLNKITEKECLCTGLSVPALQKNGISTLKSGGDGVSVCPGPNMAYFSKELSLHEMTDHITGKTNVISRADRPNVFMKELGIYMKYYKDKFEDEKDNISKKQHKNLVSFGENLNSGINYYRNLFRSSKKSFISNNLEVISALNLTQNELNDTILELKSTEV